MKSVRYFYLVFGILSVASVIGGWELIAALNLSKNIDIPGALRVGERMFAIREQLGYELLQTLYRAAFGLLLAILIMIPLGIVLGRITFWARLFEPIIDLLRPLPTPAIIPLVMLIAGISDGAKIGVIFYGTSFPILLNTIDAVRGVHPTISLSAQSLRLTPYEAFYFVYLPAGLPQIMAGIRTSVSIALLIGVTSEMLLSTDGLGVFLVRSQETFRLTDGLAAISLLAICAFLINRLNLWVERRVLFWHHESNRDRIGD
jgi:NitT/TauT family transport system permease protein